MTRRAGDQVLRYQPSSVLKLPIGGTPFTASNESVTPVRLLVVDLVADAFRDFTSSAETE